MTLEPGLAAAFRYTVTEADTPVALGSGEVPVLATPRVLALAEQATVAAVAGRRLWSAVPLRQGDRLVASGHVIRVVVDAAAFLQDAGAGAEAAR